MVRNNLNVNVKPRRKDKSRLLQTLPGGSQISAEGANFSLSEINGIVWLRYMLHLASLENVKFNS